MPNAVFPTRSKSSGFIAKQHIPEHFLGVLENGMNMMMILVMCVLTVKYHIPGAAQRKALPNF